MKTALSHAVAVALEAHGFKLTQTGGNCSAFIRDDGQIEEVITRADDASAPESLTERVAVGTAEHGDGPDENPLTTYTVADVLAALRNPSDEYYLLSLRLQNDLHKAAV